VRILLFTPGLGLGGSERLTLAYARGLSARGHQTLIAHGPPVRLGDIADAAGIARRLVREDRLTARTLPHWLRDLRALVSEFKPDVMLVDIGMPGMEGYEVARRIRGYPELQNVRLVAQTGWGGDVERQRSRAAGFDDHVVKPVTLAKLAEILDVPLGTVKSRLHAAVAAFGQSYKSAAKALG
jgi:CheY-like chemotaxis protein